jgi:hypothetical protein
MDNQNPNPQLRSFKSVSLSGVDVASTRSHYSKSSTATPASRLQRDPDEESTGTAARPAAPPLAAPKVQRTMARVASVRGIVPEFLFHKNLREREARERAARYKTQQDVSVCLRCDGSCDFFLTIETQARLVACKLKRDL